MVDLCSGSGLTSCALGLRDARVKAVTAVDLRPPQAGWADVARRGEWGGRCGVGVKKVVWVMGKGSWHGGGGDYSDSL